MQRVSWVYTHCHQSEGHVDCPHTEGQVFGLVKISLEHSGGIVDDLEGGMWLICVTVTSNINSLALAEPTTCFHTTDRIKSRQLAAQVDGEHDDDGLPVSVLGEELACGDAALSVGGLLLHFFELSKHLFCTASQPQQGCGVKTSC